MSINLSTDPAFSGLITPADANYPHGSTLNDSTGIAGDGTPLIKKLVDDNLGLTQAMLEESNITPSGLADTAILSEQMQALVEKASGRAQLMKEAAESVANVYVL